jgi:hypothetical protein
MQEEEGVSVQETESPSVTAEKRLPYGIHKYMPLVTLIICVTISLIFMKTGLLSLIYLMPLGYAIIVSGNFLPVFITAAAVNLVMVIIQPLSNTGGLNYILLEALYLISVLFGFSWIVGGKFMRTVYRFIIASVLCTIIFLVLINSPSSGILKIFNETAEEIFNNYNLGSEKNAKDLLFMQTFTPQGIVELAKMFLLRGGALISMFFLFFVNRQIAVSIVSLIKKQKIDRGLAAFYSPVNTIWVLSGSLASIVLTVIFKIEILEIISWNVFTVCVIIFLAQGIGILMYWMSLRTNAFRLMINVLIIVVLFSPLGLFAVAALILLGIIDNWRSFRIVKSVQ